MDPGLGKTSVSLAAIKVLKKQKMLSRVLVIAPLRVCYEVWPKEQQLWQDFKDLKVVVLHGPKKNELIQEDADIFVINPEGLEWLLGAKRVKNAFTGKATLTIDKKRFQRLGFDTLIVDELSRFKHPRTNRFKLLKQVLPTFSRRWGLTGSPAPNGLLDLFGQCYVLDLGHALGRYITHYHNKYFQPADYMGYTWKLQDGAEKKIYRALAPLVLRMSAEDHINTPKVVPNNIFVELPTKAYKVYDKLEQDLIAQLEEGEVVAANAAAASIKCRQVASGGVYLDPELGAELVKGPSKSTHLHTVKVDALAELVAELQGQPLLVAYDFKHDLERLQQKFGKDVPYIGGGVKPARVAELLEAWNNDELPLLLGHPQAMAHGLNLQRGSCRHVCWHSLTWDYELYDQLIRRVRRQGNKAKHVVVHHILARGTIDEAILKALQGKARGQQALFQALKDLRSERLK